MKHILVTGGNGQLGSSLRRISGSWRNYRFSFIDMDDLDLTLSRETRDYFEGSSVDYLIHCAAYTAVDKAENDADNAFRINAGIPGLLDKIARQRKIRVVHISTDYVYDGKLSVPHQEIEMPDPLSVYAKSKFDGERAFHDNPDAIVIRTSWLYSEFGNNFLTNMLQLGMTQKELGVVFDQTGTPTYAGDLARALLEIISFSDEHGMISGIYNYSNEGVCSWYDFAAEIMQHSRKDCRVRPIRTADYPLPARRPEYSVMDKSKIKRVFGLKIPYWRNSLFTVLEDLGKIKEI